MTNARDRPLADLATLQRTLREQGALVLTARGPRELVDASSELA